MLRIIPTQITNDLMKKTSTFTYIKLLDSGNFSRIKFKVLEMKHMEQLINLLKVTRKCK